MIVEDGMQVIPEIEVNAAIPTLVIDTKAADLVSDHGASTTKSIKRRINALIDISEELFELLNVVMMNPKEFLRWISETKEFNVTAAEGNELRDVLTEYEKLSKKKLLLRSENLQDVGIEYHSALSKKTNFDVSDRVNELNEGVTETLAISIDRLIETDLEVGLVALLAKNARFARRLLLEEKFEEAAFASYPAFRGQPERTILIVSRKVNLAFDKEPLGMLPYVQDIKRAEYIKQEDGVKLIFSLKDGSRRTFVN